MLKKVIFKFHNLDLNFFLKKPAYLYLVISVILFSPLFFGFFYIPGTDVNFNHYPNLFYGFSEFEKYGIFPRWSINIFNGFDFTTSFHSHWYNPFYWILILVNKKYYFYLLTLIFFISNFFLACIWNIISKRLEISSVGSLLVGIIAQASTFYWWSLTTLININALLFSSIAIYIIIILNDKNFFYQKFLLLVLSFVLILSIGHVSYIFGNILPIFLVALFLWYKKFKIILLIIAAFLSAILMMTYRWLPILNSLITNHEVRSLSNDVINHSFYLLTFVNPLFFGPNLGTSINFGNVLNYQGVHMQFHNAIYFGLIPFLICVISIIKKYNLIKLLLLFSFIISVALNVKVFDFLSALNLIFFYPFLHTAIERIMCFYTFIFLFIFSIDDFLTVLKNRFLKDNKNFFFYIFLFFFLSLILSFGAYYFNLIFHYPKYKIIYLIIFKFFLLLIILFLILLNKLKQKIKLIKFLNLLFFLSFLSFCSIVAGLVYFKISFLHSQIFTTIMKNFFIFFIFIFLNMYFLNKNNFKFTNLFLLNIFFFFGFFINLGGKGPFNTIPMSSSISFIGWITAFLIIIFFINLITTSLKRNIQYNHIISILLFVFVGEQVFAFKNYSFNNLYHSSYYTNETAYPSNFKDNLEIKNYDIKNLDLILKNYKIDSPSIFFNFSGNEVTSNINLIYDSLAYGGADSLVNQKLVDFITGMTKTEKDKSSIARGLVRNDIREQNFLNIMGIGLIFDGFDKNNSDKKIYTFNKDAVPLFTFYQNFVCVNSNEKIMELLNSKNFNLNYNVLVNHDIKSKSLCEKSDKSLELQNNFIPLNYEKINSNKFRIFLPKNKSGILLFNNNYSEFWQASDQNLKLDSVVANSIFQGFYIDNSNESIILEYKNILFERLYLFFKISFMILCVLLGFNLFLITKKNLI